MPWKHATYDVNKSDPGHMWLRQKLKKYTLTKRKKWGTKENCIPCKQNDIKIQQ